MPAPAPLRIFISYAHRDGAPLALRLQHDLTAAAFDVWLDTRALHAADTWTLEIEQAIDRSQIVLALLTPASYLSEICRAEQFRSLRQGKCVIPVLAAPGTDIPLHLEPKQYLDFTDTHSYAAAFHSLLADIAALNGAALAPPLPHHARHLCHRSAHGRELHRPPRSHPRAPRHLVRRQRPSRHRPDRARRHGRHRQDRPGASPVQG